MINEENKHAVIFLCIPECKNAKLVKFVTSANDFVEGRNLSINWEIIPYKYIFCLGLLCFYIDRSFISWLGVKP